MKKALLEEHVRYGEARFRDKELVRPFVNRIYQDLAELEEAMKPKTCKLCAYCEPFNSVCFNDKSPLCADFVNSEYGCIYWERKDNA